MTELTTYYTAEFLPFSTGGRIVSKELTKIHYFYDNMTKAIICELSFPHTTMFTKCL